MKQWNTCNDRYSEKPKYTKSEYDHQHFPIHVKTKIRSSWTRIHTTQHPDLHATVKEREKNINKK